MPGVVEEDDGLKAYGSGLLSSFGELGNFRDGPQIRPFDVEEMAAREYDPTDYQDVLYVVPSLREMDRALQAWLADL